MNTNNSSNKNNGGNNNKKYKRSRIRKGAISASQMTTQQIQNLKKQYVIWTKDAIKQMQENAIENVTKRIPIMLAVVHEIVEQYTNNRLTISEKDMAIILNNVHHEISLWSGVEVGACKTEKQLYDDYANTARNWFNRNKAKFYGNHLFYPVIFGSIYEFILLIPVINDHKKIILFVDILDGILHSTIQFRRSKPHPLIPHQTFIQPNKFRKSCCNLCKYYKVAWNLSTKNQKRKQLPNGQYAKNRHRSININNEFISKIEEIKQNVLNSGINKVLVLPHFINDNINNNSNNNNDDYSSDNDGSSSVSQSQTPKNINDDNDETEIRAYQIPRFTKLDNNNLKIEDNNNNKINNNGNNNNTNNQINPNYHYQLQQQQQQHKQQQGFIQQYNPLTNGINIDQLLNSNNNNNNYITTQYLQQNLNPLISLPSISNNIISPPQFNVLNNNINIPINTQYGLTRGQSTHVSQQRYTPLSNSGLCVSIHSNAGTNNETVTISFLNVPANQVSTIITKALSLNSPSQ